MTIINLGCQSEWSGGGQAAVFIPSVWRHHVRQLGPDIISTVINVIILIIKTFHISIAGLYLRQCRGYDDVNHRSRIRTDTTCHNRYPPPCARHTAHHSDDIKYYFILPAVNMNCAAICSSRIEKPKIPGPILPTPTLSTFGYRSNSAL